MRWKLSEEQRKRDLHGRQEALERDLEEAVATGDDLARAVALNNLGAVHADLEEWAKALARYEEAAGIVPADAPLAERVTPHGNASAAARQLDDHAAALRHALWVDALGSQASDAEQQNVGAGAVALVRKALDDDFPAALDAAVAELPEELRGLVRQDVHLHPTVRSEERPGRNDPCWCGSGKRYKNCHLKSDGG